MKLLILSLLAGGCLLGRDFSPEFAKGRQLYYQGADGNDNAYEQAEKIFAHLTEKPDADPLARAFYGSLKLWEASHTWAIWKKNSLSKEGIALLDGAVAAAPADLEVRFVRAVTTYRLPSFFHRKEQARSDFDLLASKVLKKQSGNLEPRLAAASLYYHAEFLKEDSQLADARALWRQAVRLAPGTRAAREAQAELDNQSSGG